MNEYLKEYIELQKQFRETKGNPDSVRALYTFKEKLELYKREGNASHLFLENRISDCLNTFLTGPLLDRGKRRWRVRENHL